MEEKIVTIKTLEIFNRYDKDFSLLDEPWAKKKDKEAISSEEKRILSEYIDQLDFLKVKYLSEELRESTKMKIKRLEQFIEDEVVLILQGN